MTTLEATAENLKVLLGHMSRDVDRVITYAEASERGEADPDAVSDAA